MTEGLPPAKRKKYDYDLSKTFDVLVGKKPNQRRFTVYHDVITQLSEFFRAARSERWTDPDKPTTLDDHDPEAFSEYLHCLYFGANALKGRIGAFTKAEAKSQPAQQKQRQRQKDDSSDNENDSESDSEISNSCGDNSRSSANNKSGNSNDSTRRTVDYDDKIQGLTVLYLLADKLLDPVTANLVIDQLIQRVDKGPSLPCPSLIERMYNSTTRESPLRRLLRDWYIHEVPPSGRNSVRTLAKLPRELLEDIIVEISSLTIKYPRGKLGRLFSVEIAQRPYGHYHQRVELESPASSEKKVDFS